MQTVLVHHAFPGESGPRILQCFRGIQILPVILFAHPDNGFVVGVDLRHGHIGIVTHFGDRRNGRNDDVHRGICFLNGQDLLGIALGEPFRFLRGSIEIVRTEHDDDPLRLQNGYGARYGERTRGELHARQGRDRIHAHADDTDGILYGCERCFVIIGQEAQEAGGIGIAEEKRGVNVLPAGILCFRQDGAVILVRVDNTFRSIVFLIIHLCGGLRFFHRLLRLMQDKNAQYSQCQYQHGRNEHISVPHS